ncbi:GNAT family N-acetyltransferase [Opitutales bacterium]|uniref:GNAT family N-acetyltransferase n=1 Tax=Candidatus Chordibacter forsetii TaxID=3381758 RepID=UPI0031CBCFB8|nr:GNAT family N-acetyltransferase [Opitutales bacterium]
MIRIRKVSEQTEKDLREINNLIPQLSQSAKLLTKAEFTSLLNAESTHLYFAEDKEQVLGMLSLVTFPIPTGLRGWVEDVVVDTKARGKGVGKLLTMHALKEAQKMGVLTIDLTSRPSRDVANRLYQSVGFSARVTNVYRFKHVC